MKKARQSAGECCACQAGGWPLAVNLFDTLSCQLSRLKNAITRCMTNG